MRRRIKLTCSTLAVVGLALVTGPPVLSATLPAYDRVRVVEPPRSIKDTELMDQEGEPFRLSQLYGRVALIFFGFTNCPDVCPMALGQLRNLQVSGRTDNAGVVFVMISVDGERDTPAVMKSFLGKFSKDFIGLTGDPRDVKPIAAEFRAAFFKGNSTGVGDGYSVSHSPQVFVVDQNGQLRAEFYNASVDAMASVTNALLVEASDL